MTWDSGTPPPAGAIGPLGWALVVTRGLALGINTFGCLLLLLLVRLVERPLFGARRPITPWITQYVCRSAFFILGMRWRSEGTPLRSPGAMVANHTSWLDIFALNAGTRLYFVSKSEVAGWPGIGWLARATGTVFIDRNPRQAAAQKAVFEERLGYGHHLLFFPEGTSTDGQRVLPFKPTLFAAFTTEGLRERIAVQPVTVIYEAPEGADARLYGWWGDMDFGEHLLATLSARRQGGVRVVWHDPIRVAEVPNRKALAQVAEAAVRTAHPQGEVKQ